MNSMIDAQSDTAALATVAPEEFYTDENGPTHEDFVEPVYDGPADDSHMYPDDVEQDEFPWWKSSPERDFFDMGFALPPPSPPRGAGGGSLLYHACAHLVKTFFKQFFPWLPSACQAQSPGFCKKKYPKNRWRSAALCYSLFMVIDFSPEISAENDLRDMIALTPEETAEANAWFDMVEDRWLDSMNEE